MANEEHIALLIQEGELWNEWRKANPDILLDLRSTILFHIKLIGTKLTGANLSLASTTLAVLR
jgi:hypothetical protein